MEFGSIDAARWDVEFGSGSGWVRVMESVDRKTAIQRARDEKDKSPETGIDVVAIYDDGMAIGRWDITGIPEM